MSKLFNAVANTPIATKANVRTPMTPATVADLKKKLKAQMCMNVYPNSFDIKKPYHVSIRFNNENHNFGTFVNLEVAKMVGNIASLSYFGRKSLASKVDGEAVQQEPEMVAWLNNPINADTIARAESVYDTEQVQQELPADEIQQIG